MTTSVAVKPPCRVQTIAAITLSGEQTVNGVAVVTGDRVLVKDQASSVDNGIYIADTSAWSRAPDFDGSLDAVDGTLVLVHAASGPDQIYQLSATNPVIIGTSALTFSLSSLTTSAFGASLIAAVDAAAARLILGVTTVGEAVFTAVSALAARTALGATAIGESLFTAASAAAARTAINAQVSGSYAAAGANTDITSLGGLTTAITLVAPRSYVSGLTYSPNAVDAVNDVDIAAGQAVDGTNLVLMSLAATLTKRLDAAWTVGTNQGGLDTGVVGNNDYYIWLIGRTDRATDDVLFSLSSTAPTMPAGYTYKRLIGWVKRSGATVVAFRTYETEGGGIEFLWDAPTLDVNLANTLTTSRRTDAVKVPQNFSTIAHLNVSLIDAGTSPVWIYCPDQTDAAPSITAAPLANASQINVGNNNWNGQMHIRTSATGTVAARSGTNVIDTYAVSTMGFTWARRQ